MTDLRTVRDSQKTLTNSQAAINLFLWLGLQMLSEATVFSFLAFEILHEFFLWLDLNQKPTETCRQGSQGNVVTQISSSVVQRRA